MPVAQFNIARLLAPIDSEQLAGFVAELEPVNAAADRAPGFVWRLQSDDGDGTTISPVDDEMLILNLSVWTDVEALRAFTYRDDHLDVFRQRAGWFEKMDEPHSVLWWVDQGHVPTLEESLAKLDHLRQSGPSAEAFTFATAKQFEPSTNRDVGRPTPDV